MSESGSVSQSIYKTKKTNINIRIEEESSNSSESEKIKQKKVEAHKKEKSDHVSGKDLLKPSSRKSSSSSSYKRDQLSPSPNERRHMMTDEDFEAKFLEMLEKQQEVVKDLV
jgi:hypothetical protein